MPSSPSREADLRALIAKPFAHRGLHGAGRIENSRAAFEAAIAARHGIELDVQGSLDGEAWVFHDYDLDRLTFAAGRIARLRSSDLKSVRLRGCDESVPALPEALEMIAARAPLLIEIKASRATLAPLCAAVLRALESYSGPAAIMSYHPGVGRWFRRNAPHILRGQVIRESGKGVIRKPLLRHLAVWRAAPDFLAYRVLDLPSRFAAAQRRKGLPILAWTVRTPQDRARAAEHADQIIYEAEPR